MDKKKQQLLIEYLVSSSDTFALCQSIVDSNYFDPEFRQGVSFIKQYYSDHNTTPDNVQIEAESGLKLETREVTRDQIEYCSTEIETFCKRRALEQAVLASPALIDAGDHGTLEQNIRDAILISLNRDLGIRYFETVEERLNRMLQDNPVHPTGWTEVDELLFGGISRKEMILFSGNSGAGKSITLSNLAFNFMHTGMNVLYVSFELSEDIIAQRFDTMYTGIGRKDWKTHVSEITTRLSVEEENSGILDIVRMPSGTCTNDIHAYLKEFYLHYNMMPDLLVIDYLDKMAPNEKNISYSDVWTKDKLCAEQVRDMGDKYNMFIATASQLNRQAVNATHHDHSQIAGGISKINETDIYISIICTDTMRAAGEMTYQLQKTRNSDGCGQAVHLKWDHKYLRILDQDGNGAGGLKFNKRSDKRGIDSIIDDKPTDGNGLLDLMSSTK